MSRSIKGRTFSLVVDLSEIRLLCVLPVEERYNRPLHVCSVQGRNLYLTDLSFLTEWSSEIFYPTTNIDRNS